MKRAPAGDASRRGSTGDSFGPTPPAPGVVFMGGIALPFVDQQTIPTGFSAGPVAGTASFSVGPSNSVGQPPDHDLITPVNGQPGGLTASDVAQILDNAEAEAK